MTPRVLFFSMLTGVVLELALAGPLLLSGGEGRGYLQWLNSIQGLSAVPVERLFQYHPFRAVADWFPGGPLPLATVMVIAFQSVIFAGAILLLFITVRRISAAWSKRSA
jgi:hypothetical protein